MANSFFVSIMKASILRLHRKSKNASVLLYYHFSCNFHFYLLDPNLSDQVARHKPVSSHLANCKLPYHIYLKKDKRLRLK